MKTHAAPRPVSSRAIRSALDLLASGDADHEYIGVSSDSRTIDPDQLFVALKGDNFDAADFLADVAARGARGAIVERGREDPSLPLEYFSVPDPLDALRALAADARRTAPVDVIAVTGSSGKTTVKEMVACALEETRTVYRTEGNLNSQIGLPLTILRAPADADTWVLELGASEPGEMGVLTEIAAPDHAIITTIGAAHLERFGDLAGVLREKLELARGSAQDGVLVVGEEPAELAVAARALREDAIVAGIGSDANYAPDEYEVAADRVAFSRDGTQVTLSVGGEHHLRDALIATAVAEALGTPLERAARGLSRYQPLGLRGAIRRIGGLTVLADCYNANPDSFRAAIAQCRDLFPGFRRVAYVGSMLELGDHEGSAHREIAAELVDGGFELIAATGAFSEVIFDGRCTVISELEPADAWERFADNLEGNELILVKASRGARLERVLERLESRFGDQA